MGAVLTAGAAAVLARPCEAGGPCRADWNDDYALNTVDYYEFLDDFFDGDADYNGDGVTDSRDYFAFLDDFFAGCTFCPDLRITAVDGPAYVTPGCAFDATATVVNAGTSPVSGPVAFGGWLSLDAFCCNGPDNAPLGVRTATIDPPLPPGDSRSVTVTSLFPPDNVAFGQQHLFICADANNAVNECRESNNCGSSPQIVANASAAITGVFHPATAISGRPVTIRFDISNTSSCVLNVPVLVTLRSASCGGTYTVQPFQTVQRSCTLTAPPSREDCGGVNNYTVRVCANLPGDPNDTDDCRSSTIGLIDEYPDLRYDIVGAPPSTRRCRTVTWDVVVTNVGNRNSDAVCSRTAICRDTSPTNWTRCINCPGIVFFTVPSLPPGGTFTRRVSYMICCNAVTETQHVKAGPDYFSGCFDNCNPVDDEHPDGNNNARVPIQIRQ